MSTIGALVIALFAASGHAADGPIQLKVVGGLAAVSQYEQFEKPFWTRDVPRLTGGRVEADIHPFDQSGLSGQEMLQFMRLGVVPFGTALLAMVSADEPELNAVDLPLLNPDMPSLRKTVTLYRQRLHQILQRKYGVELLSIYAYPAQVLYCAQPFAGLRDLAGRKVRTSSVGQSEMMSALGAIPVITPFAEIVSAIKSKVVDCAITGTMSGNQIGLPNVTSYIYPMAISWGLSFFGVNMAAWDQLPPDVRDTLQTGIGRLEIQIWDAADRQTADGPGMRYRHQGMRRRQDLSHDARAGFSAGRRTARADAGRKHSATLGAALRQRLRDRLERDIGAGLGDRGRGRIAFAHLIAPPPDTAAAAPASAPSTAVPRTCTAHRTPPTPPAPRARPTRRRSCAPRSPPATTAAHSAWR